MIPEQTSLQPVKTQNHRLEIPLSRTSDVVCPPDRLKPENGGSRLRSSSLGGRNRCLTTEGSADGRSWRSRTPGMRRRRSARFSPTFMTAGRREHDSTAANPVPRSRVTADVRASDYRRRRPRNSPRRGDDRGIPLRHAASESSPARLDRLTSPSCRRRARSTNRQPNYHYGL